MRTRMIGVPIVGFATLGLSPVTVGQPSNSPGDNSGNVTVFAAAGNEIVSLATTIIVPEFPLRSPGHDGTLFLWPGLQPHPDYANFLPIGTGVLQSVLSWGPSCAPGRKPGGWWISAQYVNTLGSYTGYEGCFGGPIIGVNPKDQLLIAMSLERDTWTQTVLNLVTKESTNFHYSLGGQVQAYARFQIEAYEGAISPDVTFLNTTIGFAHPDAENCKVGQQGLDDTVATPVLADDKLSCVLANIRLKGPSSANLGKVDSQTR